MTVENLIVMVLVKLKKNFNFSDMAVLFEMNENLIAKYTNFQLWSLHYTGHQKKKTNKIFQIVSNKNLEIQDLYVIALKLNYKNQSL